MKGKTNIISLFIFANGKFSHSLTNDYFIYCSKSLIKSLAKEAPKRLFCESGNLIENFLDKVITTDGK